jgi:hypothetical protein
MKILCNTAEPNICPGISHEHGMPVPAVRPTPGRRRYRYEPSTSNVITKSPLLRDPYEHRYVYVRDSGLPLAGEGLYAKTKIKEESVLVCKRVHCTMYIEKYVT